MRSFAHGSTYNPSEREMNKCRKKVNGYFTEEKNTYEGPVSVELLCFFERKKCHVGRRGVKRSAPVHHTHKPDCDNVNKFVLDVLTGIAFKDDKQIINLTTRKFWSCEEDSMRVTVTYLS